MVSESQKRPRLLHQRVGLPQGDAPARLVLALRSWGHADAVDDRAHAHTQGAAGAVRGHARQVGGGVKGYSLIAGIVTDHITLATIDTHVLVNDGHYLLSVVQGIVRADTREGLTNHILRVWCIW